MLKKIIKKINILLDTMGTNSLCLTMDSDSMYYYNAITSIDK